nr:MAG TPA: hypothetical protein [Caudoviricetes sp.]
MSEVKVFFVEQTDRVSLRLRRYRSADETCPAPAGVSFCNASVPFGEAPANRRADGYLGVPLVSAPADDDARWPTVCEACGHSFDARDPRQLFQDTIYRNPQTGAEWPMRELPVGACYDAWWNGRKGPDGRALTVICPDKSPWSIDGRANNCTVPKDDIHRCWCRHGSPEEGTLHVDKVGDTCGAGAGSIQTSNYHGFLHNGRFRAC